MATKTRAKPKTIKKVTAKAAKSAKAAAAKVKPAKRKVVTAAPVKKAAKTPRKSAGGAKRSARAAVEPRVSAPSRQGASKVTPIQKQRASEHASAIHAYEAGLKAMHAEDYEKAIRVFESLIADFQDEPEIQERARVLIHACEKRRQERNSSVFRSADDHYNMGIAELNRRQLDLATQHLQQALKLSPKGEHILYAMAAVNALKGNRDDALSYLKQSIHHRPENRFMAARDSDFEALVEDADFKQLVTSSES